MCERSEGFCHGLKLGIATWRVNSSARNLSASSEKNSVPLSVPRHLTRGLPSTLGRYTQRCRCEEGLHALRELLRGVVAHKVQVEAPRRVVQESDPPDVAVRFRHG